MELKQRLPETAAAVFLFMLNYCCDGIYTELIEK